LQPLQTPASITVEATSVAIADLLAMLPIVKRVDSLVIQFTSPTMRHAIRVLNSLSAMSSVLR
jgi:D-amino peptidase